MGEVGDQAGSYRVLGLSLEGAEVPHHLPDTLSKTQRPVVDCQGPRIKVSLGEKIDLSEL